jgi:hypothetical protein
MLTDSPPRKNRAEFLESDRVKSLDVPQNGTLLEIAKRPTASDFYQVPPCAIRVLATRPLRVRVERRDRLRIAN